MVKTLYLVRHAHYRIPHPKPGGGSSGRVLTIEGIEDVINLAHKLKHEDRNIKYIYSSPYQRTKETSQLLAKTLRIEDIQIRDKLQENYIGGGDQEHLKHVFNDFREIVEEALDNTEGNSIIVSHRMPISVYASRESGISYENIAKEKKHYALVKMGDCLKLLYNRKSFIKYEKF